MRVRLPFHPPQRPSLRAVRVAQPTRAASTARATSFSRPQQARAALLSALIGGTILYSFSLGASSTTVAAQKPASSPTALSKPAHDTKAALDKIKAALKPDQITFDENETELHGASPWSHLATRRHAAVIFPESTVDVVAIVKACQEHNVPIVPYGGGTSLEGHTAGTDAHLDGRHSVSLDFSRMKAILRLSEEDGDVTVQPGIGWEDLNAELDRRGTGLFFPIDPGPTASIGGMASTGCSGTNAVRYGTMKGDYVLNVTVVLPSGEVVTTRSRARKSSVGPDLTKLFLGSEATLGVIVAITLRLVPKLPNAVVAATFPTVDDAVAASGAVLRVGLQPQCVELMDGAMIGAVNRAAEDDPETPSMPGGEVPTIFLKLSGASSKHLAADYELAKGIFEQFGASHIQYGDNQQDIDRLWRARKVAFWSALSYPKPPEPEAEDAEEKYGIWRAWVTDVCVPVGQLPALVKRVSADIKEHNLYAPILGHVGDGNFVSRSCKCRLPDSF